MPRKPKMPSITPDAAVPASVARQIDENLRRIYAARLTEDIPDRLQDILRQLRDKDAAP